MPAGLLPKRKHVCTFEATASSTLNIRVLEGNQGRQCVGAASSEESPYSVVTGKFGSPCITVRRELGPTASHNCLHDSVDWARIDSHDFLRIAKEVSAEDLFECITTDKMYSKTGERAWDLGEFVLQRKDRRMFIGGQGVVLFVRRQGHSTSLAMKVCYHRREEKKVERHVQRTILHLKAQGASQFVGKILVNYLTRKFFITIMPKAKYASLKSVKQEIGTLSEANIRYFFACITSALQKLHAINICHRDVKCDNVLIMHNGAPALIDFGLAIRGSASLEDFKPNPRVTQMQYYPPETKQLGNLVNDYKVDSWLLGFFLCEMILNDREHLWSKFRISGKPDWSFDLCSDCGNLETPALAPLLSKLLQRDPKDRMHVADVQYTPYLSNAGYFSEIETTEPPQIEDGNASPVAVSQEMD